jgi:hypothetical protein
MTMKMAKASKEDLDMAMDLCGVIDAVSGNWPTMPAALGDQDFDRDDDHQCGIALRHLLDIAGRGSLMRVVLGAAVMLDPRNKLVDPEADTIEHHPDRLKLLAVMKTGTAQQMQDKLTQGQATDTDDGRTWLAAFEVLKAA